MQHASTYPGDIKKAKWLFFSDQQFYIYCSFDMHSSVVDRDSLRNAIRCSHSNGIPQAAPIHSSLSTTACTSVDTFAIVHALFDRVDGYAKPARFTPHSLCVSHKEVQKLSIYCLSAESF